MKKIYRNISISFILFFLVSPNLSFASLSVANTSAYIGNGQWHWKIFVNGDHETLSQIECVEYTLHPTFPEPVKRRCDRSSNFALEANGWGTFVVKVRVFYNNHTTQDFEHLLVFKEKRSRVSHGGMKAENWSRQIETGWWEWGIFIEGSQDELDRIRCVEYTLHSSFPNPVRTVCTRNNKFEMKTKGWGVFEIPVKVLLKDGAVLNLSHRLHFDN